MTESHPIRFFLGANTPGGFHSLYHAMLPPEQARAIYILKGGPGCGKSTLMRRMARRALDLGLQQEQILCSGDPDSLDALILPERKIALADGTSPHVMEAKYPGAVERYINLGACYDSRALYPIRQEIMDCKARCAHHYRRAYRCLEASASLREDLRIPLLTQELAQKLAKRAKGIVSREFPPRKTTIPGSVTQRFLSTPSHSGFVFLEDTALALCPRVYQLADRFGLGHELLLHLLAGATGRGYPVIACPDPMATDRLAHLLVPQAGVAFLTAPQALSVKPYRRLRLDAMADPDILRQNRARMRFSRRVSADLLEEGLLSLRDAKQAHDDLEALYFPHVDFSAVDRMTADVEAELFALE